MSHAVIELLMAVQHERVDQARRLLAAHPSLVTESVHVAAATGDTASVQALLASDRTHAVRGIGPFNTPPLVFAVQSGLPRALGVSETAQAGLVHALLEAGADPNTTIALPDVHGAIPVLFFPCDAGNVPVARVLLEAGAQATDGESLYHAAQRDHREVLALLRAHGADLSRGPAGVGNTPLHFLASHRVSNPVAPTVVRGMAWLLEHGADPTVPLTAVGDGQHASQLGETPLHRAAANGFAGDVLALLVAHGADVDATRLDGTTPYALAVRSGNTGGANWLAAQGADRTRCRAIDRLLCACLNADGDEARAIVAAHPDIVAEMTDADGGALLQALVEHRHEAVHLMLTLGWPLTPQSEWGGTALHWCAWNGEVALVRSLLAHGAPVNVRDTRYGSSPLAWAAHGSLHHGSGSDADYVTICELLLDAGATRDESINRWQEPPESMARPAVVAALRARGFVRESA